MVVLKFGGSSLKSAERIINISNIISKYLNKKPSIILSALGDTTDILESIAENTDNHNNINHLIDYHLQVSKGLGIEFDDQKLFDQLKLKLETIKNSNQYNLNDKAEILSFGERLSIRLISQYLNSKGLNTEAFDAWEIGVISNGQALESKVNFSQYPNINKLITEKTNNFKSIPIISGFIAKNENNISLLGRGGSDLTATIIGSALNAKEILIFKDVNGILSANPKVVTDSQTIDQISFNEASELAYAGAQVLHPFSIRPARKYNIPIRIKNSYKQTHPGTLISKQSSDSSIKAVVAKENISIIDIPLTQSIDIDELGFLSKVFSLFSEFNISVDMVSTSEASVSVTIKNNYKISKKLLQRLNELGDVKFSLNMSLISLIGNMNSATWTIENTANILNKNKIEIKMLSFGSSKSQIGFVIDQKHTNNCLNLIHKHLILK